MLCRPLVGLGFVVVLAAGCAAPRPVPVRPPSPAPPSPDPRIRALAEILRAEDRRVLDEALVARLADADPTIRAKAVLALGRIGEEGARQHIEGRVADEASKVRAAAALALGLTGNAAAEAALATLATDPEPEVRARAVEAIGRLGATSLPAAVVAALGDPLPIVRFEAALSAWKLPDPVPALDGLIELLADEDRAVRFGAAYALARLGSAPFAPPSSGARVARLSDSDLRRVRAAAAGAASDPEAEVRMQVARALTQPTGSSESAALGLLVGDRDVRVRINALRAFAYPGAPVEPHLKRALLEGDRRVLRTVVEGLGRVGGPDAEKILRDGVRGRGNRSPWILEAAFQSLAQVNPSLRAEIATLLASSPEEVLRAAAGPILVGVTDPGALETARRLTADPSPRVAAAAIPAAAEVADAFTTVLPAAAASPDPVVRAAVAEACGRRIGEAGAIALLEKIWAGSAGDSIPDARLEVVAAAAKSPDDPRASALIRAALESPDWLVRKRAAGANGAIGAATELPIEHYEEIVRWAGSPRAAAISVERAGAPPVGFTVRLDTENAPLASWNFSRLAAKKYFDGLVVHRVVPNFVVQDGDPRGDGWGGPGYAIRDEWGAVHFSAGTLGMASDGKDTAGSQWFVTLSAQPHLDGRYTPFGRVVLNLPVVIAIEPGDRVVGIVPYEGSGEEPPVSSAETKAVP